jgi:hypothetical protein
MCEELRDGPHSGSVDESGGVIDDPRMMQHATYPDLISKREDVLNALSDRKTTNCNSLSVHNFDKTRTILN